MSYDTWKTTNPADEHLGRRPMTKSEKLDEARRRWQAAEFNYAKNPINTMKIRLDRARAALAKLRT